MKLKTIEVEGKTYAEIADNKPVYVDDSGKEIAFDAPGTIATIARLNGEAKGHREAKEKAENSLKAFEGITDPTSALKALETVKNLDDKTLVDAGEVEKVKKEAIKAVEQKYAPIIEERDKLKGDLYSEKIGGSFARSKYAAENLIIPADMVQAQFGRHFTIDDGKTVAKDANGNQIFSKSKPGEPADFDEALERIVTSYPHRDAILKGSGAQGGGAKGNGAGGGAKTISRTEFDTLSHADRAAKIKDGVTISG